MLQQFRDMSRLGCSPGPVPAVTRMDITQVSSTHQYSIKWENCAIEPLTRTPMTQWLNDSMAQFLVLGTLATRYSEGRNISTP